ncbi:MAG: biotin transporter BioY [Longimicrobiales bacterium]|nr:biotin transporter BioY [Longimicrobiales bacterium]
MSSVANTLRTLSAHQVVADDRARTGIGMVAFVLAMSFGAYVAVPLPWTPVPMTLQPLFVLLAGAVLGPRAGAGAMAGYLMVGAAGAPVFSLGGAGLPWLLGPTGGYLVAMPAAAWLVGAAAGRDAGWLRLLGALTLGMATIYLGGLAHLFLLTRQEIGALLAVGVLPFLAGDVTKILAAALLARSIRSSSLGR